MSQKDAHDAHDLLVEKVAAYMWSAAQLAERGGHHINGWREASEFNRSHYKAHARAILAIVAEAVKEPTVKMHEEGIYADTNHYDGAYTPVNKIWNAMLSASPLTPGDGG